MPRTKSRQTERTLDKKARTKVKKAFKQLKEYVVTYLPPENVFPNPWNPNRQTDDEFKLLVRSMREDGFTQPILVNKNDMVIVDGEHRWRASQHIGLTEIPMVLADMTDAQMRISTLRHNRARGTEDLDRTVRIMQDLQKLGALDKATQSLGMSSDEMNDLLNDLPAPEVQKYEEFSVSWIPDVEVIPAEGIYRDRRREFEASSPEVHQQQLEIANAAASAKTEFERQDILRNKKPEVAISAIFTEDQYALVFEMLGDAFALRLLRLCEYHLEKIAK